MAVSLKPLKDQVIVITGASSGIGLVTARMAAKQGGKVVLAARNEEALRQLTEEIRGQGGQAIYVVADVGKEEDVNRIAVAAIDSFGRFDTWVNNAGVSIFGRCEEVTIPDTVVRSSLPRSRRQRPLSRWLRLAGTGHSPGLDSFRQFVCES